MSISNLNFVITIYGSQKTEIATYIYKKQLAAVRGGDAF